jgi:polysaccharide biosynthesis/export protein
MKLKFLIAFLSVVLILSSCRTLQPNKLFQAQHAQYSDFKPLEKEYLIKPFDKLNIRISTNDGFKLINIEGTQMLINGLEYLVEFDGKIKVPTLGRIDIAGKTIRDAEAFLENRYKEYYQNPFVQINVTNRRVIVFSQGSEAASVIDMDNENFTLIEALAKVGGLSNLSKSYKIKLLRGDLNNPEVYLFNIYALKDMTKANFLLQANDIIYVESRPKYVSKILEEIAPYLSLITTGLMVYGLFIK